MAQGRKGRSSTAVGEANMSEGDAATRSKFGGDRRGSLPKGSGPSDQGKFAKNKFLPQPSYKSKRGDGDSSV